MKRATVFAALTLCLSMIPTTHAAPAPAAKAQTDIDVVVCLDVSGSMNGLVESARAKLWDIVNNLGKIKPTPNLRVSLYSYGHQTYSKESGWVRQEIGLTDDLDTVYKKLFALTLNGGTELVARVVKTSLEKENWSKKKNALRIIFVCGNESASQDKQNSLADVAKLAVKNDVVVNTIYCTSPSFREDKGWAQLSALAEGSHARIDQNKGIVRIATPHDKKLAELSGKLNTTYLACGNEKLRKDVKAQQSAQDRNAARSGGGVAAGRALSKASALYRNARWDLVDRYKLDPKKFDITKIPVEHLPKEMQKMKPAERVAHIKKMLAKRKEIQDEIKKLSVLREQYRQKEMKKRNLKTDKAFDAAINKALESQASRKGLTIPK